MATIDLATVPQTVRWRSTLKVGAIVVVGLLGFLLFLNVSSTRYVDGLEVVGNSRFQEQVKGALALLREKSPDAYEIITNHIRAIVQARRSGMRLDLAKPTFELANPTAYYSLTWCASCIAHDSMHSKIYHDYMRAHAGVRKPEDWSSHVEEEKKCNAHQLQVLRDLGAPFVEIDHCASQDGTHADVNRDGKYDWDDYEKGKW